MNNEYRVTCIRCGKEYNSLMEDGVSGPCPYCEPMDHILRLKKMNEKLDELIPGKQKSDPTVVNSSKAKEIVENHKRISKAEYYLNIAKDVCKRGTCLRRNYGAVIVKNDEIIATGYTGAPRYRKNCCEIGSCIRQKLNVPRGERYELCRSVHAEMNAIISAARKDMIDATLYLYGEDVETGESVKEPAPCSLCKRMIINAGIKEVISYGTVVPNETEYIIQDVPTHYGIVVKNVYKEYVINDESLEGSKGY